MKATVDQAACIGCGLCANDCPEVFEMNADKAIVKGDVPAGKEDAAKTAAANCPVQCIAVA
ncbi:MAG TPA: ferredoxin [Elusimicrobia bacterium]|nr:ferredoxin [Elusimicrobiota bacterium]HAU90377.1 ferredoxin [Elusimicrobiota bacterium]